MTLTEKLIWYVGQIENDIDYYGNQRIFEEADRIKFQSYIDILLDTREDILEMLKED